jgi:endogenous inhibitor of DNA gyrase (YacG/DUF329 family)
MPSEMPATPCPDCGLLVSLKRVSGSFPNATIECPHCGYWFALAPDEAAASEGIMTADSSDR